jgi:hypothetical protein
MALTAITTITPPLPPPPFRSPSHSTRLGGDSPSRADAAAKRARKSPTAAASWERAAAAEAESGATRYRLTWWVGVGGCGWVGGCLRVCVCVRVCACSQLKLYKNRCISTQTKCQDKQIEHYDKEHIIYHIVLSYAIIGYSTPTKNTYYFILCYILYYIMLHEVDIG